MKKGILLCSIVVSLIFVSCGIIFGQQPHLAIKGKVIDKHSMMPLQGGFVEIENASGGSGYSRVYTDEKGEFLFKNMPAGVSFNLYVEKKGYTSFRRRYWNIDKNKEIETIVVKVSKEAILQCRVTASDKVTPVKRARVNIKPMRWRRDQYAVYEFERETNDKGEVTIDKIPEGTYELIIEKSGYINERLTNIAFITGKYKEMVVPLYRPASISGKILLMDEETTLAGIPIISRGPCTRTYTSNFKGSYSLRDLKPGTYGFTANKTGFKPYTYRGSITIREGEDINGVDHYLEAEPENVKIAIYQEVYPQKDDIKFAVRAFRSEDFELQFYRIPIKWYMKNPHAFQGLLDRKSSLDDFKVIYNSQYGFKRYRPYRWFSKEIRAKKAFSPGIYLVRATTAHAEDRNFIFV
ncbi:MAG: carboxypeptidase-like regulatory domain-containing protein, partial [Thermodesulfobacteriota bacterium]|nr:carboxypeptidase-like regulatory domain-containing protein [Thermodesulfobacteriota bacterium]